MRYGNMEFYRGQSAGEGGIGVTIYENPVRFFFDQDFFDLFQHPAGHSSVGCAVDADVVVRFGNIRFLEENIRHIGVKMLSGVDDYFSKA